MIFENNAAHQQREADQMSKSSSQFRSKIPDSQSVVKSVSIKDTISR